MSVKEGNEYKFEFEYAGNKVWATTSIPAAPQNFTCDAEDGRLQHTNRLSEESDTVRTINYTWDNPDSDYHLFYINNFETWTSYIYNYYKPTQRYLTSDPQNDTIHSVNSLGFYMFGRHHMILFKVNQEFIDLYYYQSTGSQTLVNPPTNINNGYGIFTGINSDTLILTLY